MSVTLCPFRSIQADRIRIEAAYRTCKNYNYRHKSIRFKVWSVGVPVKREFVSLNFAIPYILIEIFIARIVQ